MKARIFEGLFLCFLCFLCSLFFVVGGDAQTDKTEKPVWTLEFIQVRSDNFGPAMGYLDDHWMRVRAEAKRQGVVLDYHRIQDVVLEIPGHKVGDPNSIVLVTEYKNVDAFLKSQKLFDSMRERPNWQTGGVMHRRRPEDLFEVLNTQVFVEEPDTGTGFKLIAKQ